jgi:hypothetical protein
MELSTLSTLAAVQAISIHSCRSSADRSGDRVRRLVHHVIVAAEGELEKPFDSLRLSSIFVFRLSNPVLGHLHALSGYWTGGSIALLAGGLFWTIFQYRGIYLFWQMTEMAKL